MPETIEHILLQFIEGEIDGKKHEDPEWLIEKFDVVEQMIQQESENLKEYDERFDPITDWVIAGKVWGFMLGIAFAFEMLETFQNSGLE